MGIRPTNGSEVKGACHTDPADAGEVSAFPSPLLGDYPVSGVQWNPPEP
jgi:hypothetical protein